MRLPDFLVIGAMKSGTTTLYHDLLAHPDLFLPIDKEVHALIEPDAAEHVDRYAAHFARARADQRCGEASTGYTKRPVYEGVAERARAILGPELRLIYILRDPIDRIISHHYHAYSWGEAPQDINVAVRENPDFVNFSRYAYQLEPWLEAFGRDRVLVLSFEAYTQDRAAGARAVYEFLGVDPEPGHRIDPDAVYNKGEARPFHRGLTTRINQARLYRSVIRPLLPLGLRAAIRKRVSPPPPPRPAPPSLEIVQWLEAELADDLSRLRTLYPEVCGSWLRTGGRGAGIKGVAG